MNKGAAGTRSGDHRPQPTIVGKALSSTPHHRDDRAVQAARMRGAPNFAADFAPLRPPQNRIPHAPLARSLTRSCDPSAARSSGRPRHQQTDGGSHANPDRTHPGMARGPSQDPSGDLSTWHARGTATGSQAVPQAQAAMGRVRATGRRCRPAIVMFRGAYMTALSPTAL